MIRKIYRFIIVSCIRNAFFTAQKTCGIGLARTALMTLNSFGWVEKESTELYEGMKQ